MFWYMPDAHTVWISFCDIILNTVLIHIVKRFLPMPAAFQTTALCVIAL